MTDIDTGERAVGHRPQWIVVVLIGILGFAAAFVLTFEQPTLRVAIHQGVEGVALKEMARQFSDEFNVAVEVFDLPYGALYDAEMRELAGSQPKYDVVMVDDPWLPALIGEDEPTGESTRLQRLQLTADECNRLELGDFVPSTLQVSVHPMDPQASGRDSSRPQVASFTCDEPAGAFYALPFVGNSQLFVTRGDVTPATWDEVREESAASSDAGYVTRVGAGNSIVTDFLPILWTLRPKATDVSRTAAPGMRVAENPLALEEQPAKDAFEFLRALGANAKTRRGVVSVDDFDLTISLVQRKASMSIAWSAWVMAIAKLPSPYSDRLLAQRAGRQSELRIGQVPGGEPVLGAWLLSVTARSPRADLARTFVLFATSAEQIRKAAILGNPPPRVSVLKELAGKYSFFPAQLESLRVARARPRTPHWRAIEDVLGDCLTALYENAITSADDAWERVEEGLDPIRDKQRRIEGLLAKSGDDRAETHSTIRAILDEPATAFSCQAAAGEPGRSND